MKSLFFVIIVSLFFCAKVWAAPDFPPRDKGPIQPITEAQAEAEEEAPKESVTPESARTNRTTDVKLAEINVTVLFGTNQNGDKSYKVDYRVIENQKTDSKEDAPPVKVSYKRKEDKNHYGVSEVQVKKNESGTYKITASIIEKKDEEEIIPKITYLD